ncbi:TetR/AcrR family transcriptional regulator [Nocardia sp. NBC_00565]|uniref:TetR/AcrR family transcriptional regulator n=1 Tax=Nocardia sp. NBC_00565 TaxID=2975993 RepID=UPI002E80B6A4|nr:TetR/AcrR family transcriptional regulator [Nocardia sp. NBC_00565]WUC03239.1 TetR/AcrR family transcriptional regulator [Nocardia sp. NBC_00565]
MTRAAGRPQGRAGHEDRRAAILQAALEVFAERGYQGATIAIVAERVGLSQQGVLHYFPNKQDLLANVLALRDQNDLDVLLATAQGSATTLDFLADLVERNAERPGIVQSFTVLAAESVTQDHPARDYFIDRYAQTRRMLTTMLERDLDGDPPRGVSHQEAATLLIAVLDGLQQQWLLSPDEVDMPALLRTFLRLIRPENLK